MDRPRTIERIEAEKDLPLLAVAATLLARRFDPAGGVARLHELIDKAGEYPHPEPQLRVNVFEAGDGDTYLMEGLRQFMSAR